MSKRNGTFSLNKNPYVRRVAQVLSMTLIITISLFALAGRIDYWQGWVFTISCFIFLGIMSLTFRKKRDLIEERGNPGPGVKGWDKIILSIHTILVVLSIITATLDVGRYRFSHIPSGLYISSYIVFVGSLVLIYWSMWTNRFFSTNVRIQNDRGHSVIQTGPYRFIRHPGYLGMITMWVSGVLVLGSLVALIASIAIAVVLVIRTSLEDKVLQRELQGYSTYTHKVRCRLFPGIW